MGNNIKDLIKYKVKIYIILKKTKNHYIWVYSDLVKKTKKGGVIYEKINEKI